MTKFIAIVSGKGGTGKTTTAVNLGTSLTNFGVDCVVLDANLKTPHIAIHLGQTRIDIALQDVLTGERNITEAAYMHPTGLKIIPSHISPREVKKSDLKKFKSIIADLIGTTKLVLIDTPPGINDDLVNIIKSVDQVLIVTNPDMPSISEALKVIHIAKEHNKEVLGVVVNRVTRDKFDMERNNIEAFLEAKVIAEIPEDNKVKRSIAMKHPVVYTHPDAPSSVAFKKLAAKLMGQKYKPSLSEKPDKINKLLSRLGV